MLSRAELEDRFFGFKDLGRFKKAIDSNDLVPEQDLIEITAGNADEIISILPDNGICMSKLSQILKRQLK